MSGYTERRKSKFKITKKTYFKLLDVIVKSVLQPNPKK